MFSGRGGARRRQGQYNLALAYKDGAGIAQDSAEAVRWCHRAAEQGFPRAAYALGISYRDGYAVQRDSIEALAWFTVAVARALDADEPEFAGARDMLAATLTRHAAVCAKPRDAILEEFSVATSYSSWPAPLRRACPCFLHQVLLV